MQCSETATRFHGENGEFGFCEKHYEENKKRFSLPTIFDFVQENFQVDAILKGVQQLLEEKLYSYGEGDIPDKSTETLEEEMLELIELYEDQSEKLKVMADERDELYADFENQKREHEEVIASLESENAKQGKELCGLQMKFIASQEEIAELRSREAKKEERVSVTEIDRETYEEALSILRKRNEDFNKQINQLHVQGREISNLTLKNNQLNEELSKLKVSYKEKLNIRDAHISNLEENNRRFEDEKAEEEKKVRILEEKLAQHKRKGLEEFFDFNSQKIADLKKVYAEKEDLAHNLDDASKAIIKLEGENQTLNLRYKDLQSKNVYLLKEIAEIMEKRDELQKNVNEFQNVNTLNKELESNLKEANAEIGKLRVANEALRQTVADCEAECTRLAGINIRFKRDKENLEYKISKADKDYRELHGEYVDLEAKKDAEIANLKAELRGGLDRSIREKNAEIANLQARINNLNREAYEEFDRLNREKSTEIANLMTRADEIFNRQMTAKNAEIIELNARIDGANRYTNALRGENNHQNAIITRAIIMIMDLQVHCSWLERELAERPQTQPIINIIGELNVLMQQRTIRQSLTLQIGNGSYDQDGDFEMSSVLSEVGDNPYSEPGFQQNGQLLEIKNEPYGETREIAHHTPFQGSVTESSNIETRVETVSYDDREVPDSNGCPFDPPCESERCNHKKDHCIKVIKSGDREGEHCNRPAEINGLYCGGWKSHCPPKEIANDDSSDNVNTEPVGTDNTNRPYDLRSRTTRK